MMWTAYLPMYGGQAKIIAHPLPDVLVAAFIGFHETPDIVCRRNILQKPPQDSTELFLLVGETEIHAFVSP